jgi:hypothetical protein
MREYKDVNDAKRDKEMWDSEVGRYWADWSGRNGYTSGGVAIAGGLFVGAGTGIILWSVINISPWIIAGTSVAGLGVGMLLMAIFVITSAHQMRKYSRK